MGNSFLLCRFFPAYYDWIYALMPDSWRFKKLCNLVHKFSMDIIKKRREELKKKEVMCIYTYTHTPVVTNANYDKPTISYSIILPDFI